MLPHQHQREKEIFAQAREEEQQNTEIPYLSDPQTPKEINNPPPTIKLPKTKTEPTGPPPQHSSKVREDLNKKSNRISIIIFTSTIFVKNINKKRKQINLH